MLTPSARRFKNDYAGQDTRAETSPLQVSRLSRQVHHRRGKNRETRSRWPRAREASSRPRVRRDGTRTRPEHARQAVRRQPAEWQACQGEDDTVSGPSTWSLNWSEINPSIWASKVARFAMTCGMATGQPKKLRIKRQGHN